MIMKNSSEIDVFMPGKVDCKFFYLNENVLTKFLADNAKTEKIFAYLDAETFNFYFKILEIDNGPI